MEYEVTETRYLAFLKNIEIAFKEASTVLQKARNEIKLVPFKGENLVVKSFKVPHLINKVVYTFFRDSKAKKSYRNSLKIKEFVPKPIGYIERTKFGLLHKSYFVCEEFPYDYTIREVLLDHEFRNREVLFEAFAEFTYALHDAGVEHLDYSPGNILIREKKGEYVFKIIDINRMRFKVLNDRERLENFSKLWAKDEDLKTIVTFYGRYIDMDPKKAWEIALRASQKHKDRKNFKKRLKGIEVVD